MEVLTLKVRALSASFRRPMDHNYHRTFPLPPPTTIYGLIGAALGLSDREMWDKNSILAEINISVLSSNKAGFAKDMWSIKKIKNNRIAETSPYFRELLFYPEFLLIFGGKEEILSKLEYGFENPEYALSLGREDELIRIEKMKREKIEGGKPVFFGTVLPLDLRKAKYKPVLEEGITMDPPVMDSIPLDFKVDKKGARAPGEKRVYSFIPYNLKIIVEEGLGNINSLDGRNFVWLNS